MTLINGVQIDELNRTTVADAAHTLVITDSIVAYTSLTATRTVTLPDALLTAIGTMFIVKDESGDAGSYPIVLDPEGATTIDDETTLSINNANMGVRFYSDGTGWRVAESFIDTNSDIIFDGSHDISGIVQGDILNNLNSFEFGAEVLSMMTDPKFLNVLCEDPSGGTLTDISGNGHDGTYTGTWTAGDRLKQGRVWVLDPNGTDAFIDLGDDDDFSFGDGTNDSPFTVFALVEVKAASAEQMIVAKVDTTTGSEAKEWQLYLNSLEKATFMARDESADALVYAQSDVLSDGLYLIVATYSGVGGANAYTGMNMYINGALDNTARSSSGSYTAMENLTTPLYIGARIGDAGIAAQLQTGNGGFVGIDAVEWSAEDVWQLWQKVLAQYSEDGTGL